MVVEDLLSQIRERIPDKAYFWESERNEIARIATDALKDASNEATVEFVLTGLRAARQDNSLFADTLRQVATDLLRRKLIFTAGQIVEMIELVSLPYRVFPYKGILNAAATVPMAPEIADALRKLRPCITEYLGGSEMRDLQARIDILLNGPAPATSLEVQGAWSQIVFAEIATAPIKAAWEKIFAHALESKSGEPSKKWMSAADSLAQEIGREAFLESALRWLAIGPSPQRPGVQLSSGESELLKGFLWFLAGNSDARLPGLLATFAEGALKKIPMLGAVSQKVGNACVNVLAELPGLAPVSQLSSLAQRVRYDTAQRLIEEALTRAAQKAGVSREQLEEMSISDFGLGPEGSLSEQLGDYRLRISIADTTSTTVEWADSQSQALKSVPAYIKEHHSERWKELQRDIKDIEKTLSAQRARIEKLLIIQRSITIDTLRKCYLDHPLLTDMSRRLIWQLDSGPAIWHKGRLVDSAEREVDLSNQTTARLWHPLWSDTQTIIHWRCWLEDHDIAQPFKQAHREVYLMTEAERETVSYSNRFAAHILRQHQFAALCEERGWEFRLMGQWDSHNNPTLDLPHANLHVQYEVNFPTNENDVSGHAIYLLIRTERVRFLNAAGTPQPLESIPPIVFSEVMRDLDLFTGVASIGLDPNWNVHGPGPFHDYWHAACFGELSEMAANRRSVLERLLPRLAIKDRSTLEARFLRVRGDRAEYRIHLGSSNIIMEPGGRYVCIVEGAATKTSPRNLPLPFEGDRVLSLILSKAFLLAGDRHIKDDRILRQLPPL